MVVRRVAVVLFALVLVAGCSGEPDPPSSAPLPSPTMPSASPEASETPTVEVDVSTSKGFIRRWVELHNTLSATGESSEFRALSGGCAECQETARMYERIYRRGGFVLGGVVTITKLDRIWRRTADETWIAYLRASPTRYRKSAESPVKTLQGGRVAFRFVLSRTNPVRIREMYQESI